MMIVTFTSVLSLVNDGLTIFLALAVIASTLLSFYLLLLAVASFHPPLTLIPREAKSRRQKAESRKQRNDERSEPLPTAYRLLPTRTGAAPATRFAILIPAHEEELVIGRLLVSINDLDYPRELFEVHVITDHCSDQTGTIAGSLGATVHERNDPNPRGKSRSLNWLVQRLLACEDDDSIDAFIILDADSTVSPNFLRTMDLHVRSGKPLIQGL